MTKDEEWKKVEKEYKEKFGRFYCVIVGQNRDDDEMLEEMKECIRTGKEQVVKPYSSISENIIYKISAVDSNIYAEQYAFMKELMPRSVGIFEAMIEKMAV